MPFNTQNVMELYNKKIGLEDYNNLFAVKTGLRTIQVKHHEGLETTLKTFIEGDFDYVLNGNHISLEQRMINRQAAIDQGLIPANTQMIVNIKSRISEF